VINIEQNQDKEEKPNLLKMEYYKITQIQVTKGTRRLLQLTRLAKRESYDEVILRLINIAKTQNDELKDKIEMAN